ncbi:MAG: hypothetical protein MI976_08370 [Pseudomonadales bacterium]|nr:hypothetical protein [Pseudomonadales bacterium]
MSNFAKKLHIYKDIAQVAIDRGLETSEAIHNTIQDFVLDMATVNIENSNSVNNLKAIPQQQVSRAYQFARDINRQVGHAVSEVLSAYEHKENIKLLVDDSD